MLQTRSQEKIRGEIELPIRYQEANVMAATFAVPSLPLTERTPGPLRLIELLPGWAPLTVICFDYRETSIGPYGEIGVGWPVVDSMAPAPPLLPVLLEDHWPGLGFWVQHLPVTTERARDAGCSIWGYPKIVAGIEFGWEGAMRTCSLQVEGARTLELRVDTRMRARRHAMRLRTFSALNAELIETVTEVDAVGLRHPSLRGATLELGADPMGRQLAALGFEGARLVQTRWFPVWRAVLPAGQPRGPVGPPKR